MRTLLQGLYAAAVVATFLASLLLLFPIFYLLGLGNAPWSRRATGGIVRQWSRGWLLLLGMPVRVSGVFPRGQRFVIVANHISYLDTLNVFAAIPVHFRTLAKQEMAALPLFGLVYKQVAILVDRASAGSRVASLRAMQQHLQQEGHIVVFPEGTFNETGAPTKAFYSGAFSLAISAQAPVLPLLFPDTVRRWHYSAWWKFWPGRNRAVFLPPISVAGMGSQDVPALRDAVRQQMDEALRQLADSQ